MNNPLVNVSRGEGEGCTKESKKDASWCRLKEKRIKDICS